MIIYEGEKKLCKHEFHIVTSVLLLSRKIISLSLSFPLLHFHLSSFALHLHFNQGRAGPAHQMIVKHAPFMSPTVKDTSSFPDDLFFPDEGSDAEGSGDQIFSASAEGFLSFFLTLSLAS